MDEDRDTQIRCLLQQGVPKMRIASRLGITRETVSRVAAQHGFPARGRGSNRYDWDLIRDYYEQGRSAADCMRQFGFSAATWRAAIARGEIVPRQRANAQLAEGKRRRQVRELHEQALGVAEIALKLGISRPTVCYHLRKLGVPAKSKFANRVDWDAVQAAHDNGMSVRECARTFGFHVGSWHQAVQRGVIVPRDHRVPLKDLLVVGRRTNRTHLKHRLISEGVLEERCADCGITEWHGRKLSLQLHHKNGDPLDNRIENLCLLCANCHSLTDTYGGRNGHRRPKREAA